MNLNLKKILLAVSLILFCNVLIYGQHEGTRSHKHKTKSSHKQIILGQQPDIFIDDIKAKQDTISSILNPYNVIIYVAIQYKGSSISEIYEIVAQSEVKLKSNATATFTINGEKKQCIGKVAMNSHLEVYWDIKKECYCLKERN